jgi:hypothetical protein
LTGIKLICVEVEHNLLQYYICKSHWSYNIQTSLCKLNQTWQNPWPRLKPDSSQTNHHKTDRLTPYCRQTQTPPKTCFYFLLPELEQWEILRLLHYLSICLSRKVIRGLIIRYADVNAIGNMVIPEPKNTVFTARSTMLLLYIVIRQSRQSRPALLRI